MAIVICIPTKLKTRQEIAAALLDRYDTDYLFSEKIFQETATNKSCEINISPVLDNNLELSQAIRLAGKNKISSNILEAINHSSTIIHLVSNNVGYEACQTIARFTQILLNIGGLAVKIESAEIAHEADKWLANYNCEDVFDFYSLYVGLVEGENSYHSCGMHNFGKADVAIHLSEDINLAIYVINVFNYYRLTESPILQDGHTFQPDIESGIYQIKLIPDREYNLNSLQYNPFGRWHLNRV
jgi:hypothetical protein